MFSVSEFSLMAVEVENEFATSFTCSPHSARPVRAGDGLRQPSAILVCDLYDAVVGL